MVKLTKLPKVLLVWVDSSGGDTGWEVIEDLSEVASDCIICESLGWILKETEEAITIAHNVSDGNKSAQPQFTMAMTIPKVAILNRRNVK